MAGGMRIVTNVAALNAVVANTNNSSSLSKSLERLSTGLKINAAKDNASGMAIANQLKTQASTLTQAIDNGNQANSVLLTADKAIEEQSNILDQIKTKATQAAQDGQSTKTRNILQADINRLMEELDNIANTTSFNGKNLLSGGFSNQEFQVGDRSNITVKTTIGSTQSSKIGLTRFETGEKIGDANGMSVGGNIRLSLKQYNGIDDFDFASVNISYSVGTGLGVLVEEINRVSNETGVRASYNIQTSGVFSVLASNTSDDFSINGVTIGRIDYQDNDQNGALVNGINAVKDTTGVTASLGANNELVLTSTDGRAVYIEGTIGVGSGIAIGDYHNFGRLSLVKNSGSDILVGVVGQGISVGAAAIGFGGVSTVSQATVSLRETKAPLGAYEADAMGMFGSHRLGAYFISGALSANAFSVAFDVGVTGTSVNAGLVNSANVSVAINFVGVYSANLAHSLVYDTANGRLVMSDIGDFENDQTAGVTTLKGAMAVMDVVETAILNVDQIRADIGSAQQQIDATINNITTTQVNLKSAESVIRDVDFASESANYSKASILAQSGAYALAQANASSQYVLQLLQ